MKKTSPYFFGTVAANIVAYLGILRLLTTTGYDKLGEAVLPGGFPTKGASMVIWGLLFLLWTVGSYFVYTVKMTPKRHQNIFANGLILAAAIFAWHYVLLGVVNFPGVLALSIAILLLTVIVWFMYLVTHRYGGYIFTPTVVWAVFMLYLGIALVVKN